MLENTSYVKTAAAGIDIGSNSVRMIVAEVENYRISQVLSSQRNSSRLASGICETGRIANGPFKKSIEILKNYKKIIDELGVTKIKTVATSAVREATNGREFIDACKNIGVNAEIISGAEEAKLSLFGVKAGINTVGKKIMIFDTGGGSTEFIAAENDNIYFNESYKIGVVKLTDMFDMRDNAINNLPLCAQYVENFLIHADLPRNIDMLIATAGTAASLAAMSMKLREYDPIKINGYSVKKSEIESMLNIIIKTPYSERSKIIGLERGREDLIIPGITIILEAMEKTGFDKLITSDYGLREGAVVVAANS